MASCWGLYFFESRAYSGHSIVNHHEKYLDINILALNLSGEYALNG